MAFSPVPVSRSLPAVKAALRASFPDYRGRKVRVAPWSGPLSLDLNWSGGTVDKVVLLDLSNGRVGKLVAPSPWARGACDPVDCPPGAVLAVHSYFCGTDAGVTFYVRPDDRALLAAPRANAPCRNSHCVLARDHSGDHLDRYGASWTPAR